MTKSSLDRPTLADLSRRLVIVNAEVDLAHLALSTGQPERHEKHMQHVAEELQSLHALALDLLTTVARDVP